MSFEGNKKRKEVDKHINISQPFHESKQQQLGVCWSINVETLTSKDPVQMESSDIPIQTVGSGQHGLDFIFTSHRGFRNRKK